MENFLILLMNGLFAATFPLGKHALEYTGPLFLTAVRMLLAGILLLTYSYVKDKKIVVKKQDWPFFIKTSFFYVFLSFVPEFWALHYLSSIKTNLLWSVQPFLAAIIGCVFFSETLSTKKLSALCIGFAGMLPIIFTADHTGSNQLLSISLPELSLLVAVISTIYAWHLLKQLLVRGYSLPLVNGITMTIGGLSCLLTALGEQCYYQQDLYSNFAAVLGYSALLVLISNVAAYGIYGYLLNRYSITFLSFTGFTCPLFGFVYSYWVGEVIPVAYLYGCALIIVGLYLFYQQE